MEKKREEKLKKRDTDNKPCLQIDTENETDRDRGETDKDEVTEIRTQADRQTGR